MTAAGRARTSQGRDRHVPITGCFFTFLHNFYYLNTL